MKLFSRFFFLPGNLVADLLRATADDDRMMIRTLIDMLFWNALLIIGAFLLIIGAFMIFS